MISIVVPCYNCDKTLARCMYSLYNQTEQKVEIVLVDDGSEDKTCELCDAFAEKDCRIKVIHQNNGGLMNAWKRGVAEATGEYVMFCDSDDYLDLDAVEVLENKADSVRADIIVYGMRMEYEDGGIIYQENQLEEGSYTREDIINQVLPSFFSSGNMESCIMQASRCSKLFKRKLLVDNFKYLSDRISIGEDALATFASVLSADTLYCMKGFYPYHYMRNNISMIGKYDALLFQKFIDLREQMFKIADAYRYAYPLQIEDYFLSKVFLCMKKEICRNKDAGYQAIRKQLKSMRENEIVVNAVCQCSVQKYDLKSRLFAYLAIRKQYFILYILTMAADKAGMGQA